MSIMSIQMCRQKFTKKYSSTQAYFYSKIINQLVQEKRSSKTTHYQDIEYFVDDDEYMKRPYNKEEFKNKMFTFKEYYFYHQDCPRIFMEDIEIIYAKWQDRKRNLVYKKLKKMFNQGGQENSITESEEQLRGVTHLLFEMSEYNPFSKKYYLRVQNRKDKLMQNRKDVHTRDQISYLKHDLSNMLKEMSQLSRISTLDSTRIEPKIKNYHRKTLTQGESGSYEHSHSNSNLGVKMNFKKKVQINLLARPQKKTKYNIMLSAEKEANEKQMEHLQNTRTISPKLNPVQNKQGSLEKMKSKSIFAFTSLGQLGQQNNKIRLNSKREGLKLSSQIRVQKPQSNKVSIEKQESANKKTITIRCNSIGKLKTNKLETLNDKNRQVSLRKLKTKPDEFCDRKLAGIAKNIDARLSSYKSEHVNIKKPALRIKMTQPISIPNKKKLEIKL